MVIVFNQVVIEYNYYSFQNLVLRYMITNKISIHFKLNLLQLLLNPFCFMYKLSSIYQVFLLFMELIKFNTLLAN